MPFWALFTTYNNTDMPDKNLNDDDEYVIVLPPEEDFIIIISQPFTEPLWGKCVNRT
tara:strand:+ start:1404 stop:1574 length:171 start_codon:yes stop_codon:yes gene_type:complete